ncbi:LuxR C-terminal-related transcriptional regulator [Agromyces sp. LHK192]|uniref:ATP-binding protein n=1 Tax=Agromyces sp. LHK192 TaxID=2498704 RepID=UPI000FD8E8FE|nr:LuxR C-terminal-related transcriptional regulator [Agromyces sp. LHK192]
MPTRHTGPRLVGVPGQALTPRERAVLAAIERRLNNSEIASELFISVRTVESHIASLRRKLGADSRAGLIDASAELRGVAIRVPATSFVGRTADLAELGRRLDRHRLVTIAGPGGVGKTRLALEHARDAGERVPVVVELEHAGPDDVAARIARAIDVESARGTDPLERCAVALSTHPYLLVLDNVDRVGESVARAAAVLLAAAPDLRIVTTSRTPIGAPEESVLQVGPLDCDGPEAPGVRMFLDRLDRWGRDPQAGDRELAQEVCSRLDGLPLAIELAASVARHLSLAELAARLDRDFTTLDRATPSGRHRTLETAFEWTWDLLDDDSRDILCRLAALPRTFDVDLATAATRPGTEGTLLRLVDHSLIVPMGGSPARFRLLAVMREFVRARTEPAVIREVLERHARYHTEIAEVFVGRARTDDSEEALQMSARLCPEVNAALRWALAAEHATALPLAAALSVGIEQYGSDVDSVHSIALAARSPRLRAEASAEDLLAMGVALSYLDVPLVEELAELALLLVADAATEPGGDRMRMAAEHLAGVAGAYRDDGERTLAHLDAAERLALEIGDGWSLAAVRQMRGIALRGAALDDPVGAIAQFSAAMHGYAAAGDAMHVNNARCMMARTAAEHGIRTEEAATWAAECVDYAGRVGNLHELAHAAMVQHLLASPEPALGAEELTETFRRLGDVRCLTQSLLIAADDGSPPSGPGSGPARRLAHLEEAQRLARDTGDRTQQARALARLTRAYRSSGDTVRARTAFGQLAALIGAEPAALAAPDGLELVD